MEIRCNYTEKPCPYPMGDNDCSSCDIYKNAVMKQNDPVNHPSHYTAGGIECIDAISAAISCQKDPVDAWLTGQIIIYLWRWPLKNGLEDLKKARFYLDRLIDNVEEN